MSEKVILINGIDTSKGGAGYNSLITWKNDLSKENVVDVISIVPSSRLKSLDLIIKIIYYFPFGFLKIFKNPIIEYFYKISFFDILKVLWISLNKDFTKIILSHHSIFYLKIFLPKKNRLFIIHDLVSFKNQKATKVGLVEKWFIKNEILLIQSSKEQIILKNEGIKSNLISCYDVKSDYTSDLSKKKSIGLNKMKIGLIADWRRELNIQDLIYFLKFGWVDELNSYNINLYGYGNENIRRIIKNLPKNISINKTFKNFRELRLDAILIPNYSGAGIKLKAVEALLNGVLVIGTEKSIEGLDEIDLKHLGVFISIEELCRTRSVSPDFEKFKKAYHEKFKNISKVICQS